MTRTSKHGGTTINSATKRRVHTELLRHTKTKVGVLKTLTVLSDAGVLAPGIVELDASLTAQRGRYSIRASANTAANIDTPYGRVVQQLRIGTDELEYWDYVHPLAFLYCLTERSSALGDIMAQCIGDGTKPLSVVIYLDEVTPGNPLRMDTTRKIWAIYWLFTDWPQHMLHNVDSWLLLGAIKCDVVNSLDGGMSEFMPKLMRIMFPESGEGLQTGAHIVCRSSDGTKRTLVFRANFGGFIADDDAHRQVWGCKGASGRKPCFGCMNCQMDRIGMPDEYWIGIDCPDVNRFHYHTDDTIFAMADKLVASVGVLAPTRFKALETNCGISYIANGMLYDSYMRKLVSPTRAMIRDWMHVFCSDGVANNEIARVLHTLKSECHLTLDDVDEWARLIVLPRHHGTVSIDWFADHRLLERKMRGFASEILTMVVLLHAYLVEVVQPTGAMPREIECIGLLKSIIDIMKLGAHRSMPHIERLKSLLHAHHTLYTTLYQTVPCAFKPKYHQALHIPSNMATWNILLSCWTTERKNKDLKAACGTVYTHMEHVTTSTMVAQQIQHFERNHLGMLAPFTLIDPHTSSIDGVIATALHARLPCGHVHAGDIIITRPFGVARVHRFVNMPNLTCHVQIDRFVRVTSDSNDTWRSTDTGMSAIIVDDVVCPAMYRLTPPVYKVILPTVVL